MIDQPAAQGLSYFIGLDADTDLRPFLDRLVWADFALRYSKNLSGSEITAIGNSGLKLGVIFEVGTGNTLGGAQQALKDCSLFLRQAGNLNLTPGAKSACFITTDTDSAAFSPAQWSAAISYYEGFLDTLNQHGWQMGGYCDGGLQQRVMAQFAHKLYYPWSPGAKGWNQTRQFDLSGQWILNQGPSMTSGQWPLPGKLIAATAQGKTPVDAFPFPACGFEYDPDIAVNLDWSL